MEIMQKMKNKLEQLNISYIGIKNPETPSEIEFEIAGLNSLISEANLRICQLRQAIIMAELVIGENKNDSNNS